jgi:ankyrin repeat protein
MMACFTQESDEASLSNKLEIIQLVLRTENVEINAQDQRGGLTPLYYAAEAGNREATEMLLDHGADPDVDVEGENIRDIIAANIDDFDFAAYVDKVKACVLTEFALTLADNYR